MKTIYEELASAVAGDDANKPHEEICQIALRTRARLAAASERADQLVVLLAEINEHVTTALRSGDFDILQGALIDIAEKTKDYPAIRAVAETVRKWEANGGTCACGRPITLNDALTAPYVCPHCMSELMSVESEL